MSVPLLVLVLAGSLQTMPAAPLVVKDARGQLPRLTGDGVVTITPPYSI